MKVSPLETLHSMMRIKKQPWLDSLLCVGCSVCSLCVHGLNNLIKLATSLEGMIFVPLLQRSEFTL